MPLWQSSHAQSADRRQFGYCQIGIPGSPEVRKLLSVNNLSDVLFVETSSGTQPAFSSVQRLRAITAPCHKQHSIGRNQSPIKKLKKEDSK
jgi:hypothetical protein